MVVSISPLCVIAGINLMITPSYTSTFFKMFYKAASGDVPEGGLVFVGDISRLNSVPEPYSEDAPDITAYGVNKIYYTNCNYIGSWVDSVFKLPQNGVNIPLLKDEK